MPAFPDVLGDCGPQLSTVDTLAPFTPLSDVSGLSKTLDRFNVGWKFTSIWGNIS
jgi:hypothetical protein